MNRPPVVLTVCLGNICRSPTAAAALEEAADAAGIEVVVRSAGTGAYHVGQPPDRRMQAAAATVDLPLGGTAEQVDAAAIEDADLVLAMDASNLRDLRGIAAAHGLTTPIVLFRTLDPQASEADADVPDPYYGGAHGFDEVVAICRRTAAAVIARLDELTGAS